MFSLIIITLAIAFPIFFGIKHIIFSIGYSRYFKRIGYSKSYAFIPVINNLLAISTLERNEEDGTLYLYKLKLHRYTYCFIGIFFQLMVVFCFYVFLLEFFTLLGLESYPLMNILMDYSEEAYIFFSFLSGIWRFSFIYNILRRISEYDNIMVVILSLVSTLCWFVFPFVTGGKRPIETILPHEVNKMR